MPDLATLLRDTAQAHFDKTPEGLTYDEWAARLIAQGVRVGDDGLRAAATEYLGWLERRADKAGDHVLCWTKASALRAALAESSDA